MTRAIEWRVRHAGEADLAAIVRIHRTSFPDSFSTSLGTRLLSLYYRYLIRENDGLVLTIEADGQVIGFVAGVTAARSLPGDFLRSCWTGLLAVIPQASFRLAQNPPALFRALNRLRPSYHGRDAVADLASLGVLPGYRRRGGARALVLSFLAQCRDRGMDSVSLGVREADRVALIFYRNLGFRTVRVGRNLKGENVFELVRSTWAEGLPVGQIQG